MTAWYQHTAAVVDDELRQAARAHSDNLTKPPGSLGVLEQVAIELSALQRRENPSLQHLAIAVFAADHGVVDEGVSAFPQVVTAEMLRNFSRGGAAITVLARELGAAFQVVNVGTVSELEPLPHVLDRRVSAGTQNFCRQPAMTAQQLAEALLAGAECVESAGSPDCFIAGEMGIGNTSSATALAAVLLSLAPMQLAGRGTGLDDAGVRHKAQVVERALALHQLDPQQPMELLRCLGGLEIAALVGAYIRAAQLSVPVLVDGFICTAAALVACRINPSIRPWLLFSHQSEEAGHGLLLQELDAQPLLQLGMRLGEGSGAGVALPLMRMACALHNGMASFSDAGVSKG